MLTPWLATGAVVTLFGFTVLLLWLNDGHRTLAARTRAPAPTPGAPLPLGSPTNADASGGPARPKLHLPPRSDSPRPAADHHDRDFSAGPPLPVATDPPPAFAVPITAPCALAPFSATPLPVGVSVAMSVTATGTATSSDFRGSVAWTAAPASTGSPPPTPSPPDHLAPLLLRFAAGLTRHHNDTRSADPAVTATAPSAHKRRTATGTHHYHFPPPRRGSTTESHKQPWAKASQAATPQVLPASRSIFALPFAQARVAAAHKLATTLGTLWLFFTIIETVQCFSVFACFEQVASS